MPVASRTNTRYYVRNKHPQYQALEDVVKLIKPSHSEALEREAYEFLGKL